MDVIIPTKNAEQDLEDCLQALKDQTIPVRVLIVDAHSTDRTREIAEEYGAIVIDEPPSNVKGSRRAVACNEGLRHSTSSVVVFVDCDTIVPERWVEDLVPYILNDPNVGSVTSGCISLDGTPLSRAISRVIKLGSTHARVFEKTVKIDSCPGYNSIYLREAIDQVGGFSEDIGGCEDWELNLRIRRAGWDIIGVPESPVEHRERQTLKAFSKQMYGYAWSRGRLLRVKHIFTLLHAFPSVCLLLFILSVVLYPVGVITLVSTMLILVLVPLFAMRRRKYLLTGIVFVAQQLSWAIGYVRGLV